MHWIYKKLYDAVFTAGLFAYSPLLMYLKERDINYIMHRFTPGRDLNLLQRPVWIHSVSLGETNASLPLISGLNNLNIETLASASTPSGYQNLITKSDTNICLAPWDTFFSVETLIKRANPKLLVIMETELWPALIIGARDKNIRVVIANARISDKAFKHYLFFKPFFKYILSYVDFVLAQSREHKEKFMELGIPSHRIDVTGNIKYDIEIPDKDLLSNLPRGKIVLLLASTHEDEEKRILSELKNANVIDHIYPIIAPRHIERAKEITQLANNLGLAPAVYSKTRGILPSMSSCLVIDVIGLLANAYKYADIAFIGGSLISHGGQNPIEAAYWQKPIIFGANMQNFKEISRQLIENDAAIQIGSERDLPKLIEEYKSNSSRFLDMGENALRVVKNNKGATQKTIRYITKMI